MKFMFLGVNMILALLHFSLSQAKNIMIIFTPANTNSIVIKYHCLVKVYFTGLFYDTRTTV